MKITDEFDTCYAENQISILKEFGRHGDFSTPRKKPSRYRRVKYWLYRKRMNLAKRIAGYDFEEQDW